MKNFQTSLAPTRSGACAGFAASGQIDPSQWATQLYHGTVSGPWLLCYMLRRFGWPNVGSDDYKQLVSWNLKTPMPGLYLCVTPYLGSGSNLHFSVRFDKNVQAKINRDPGRESFLRRRNEAVLDWWTKTGMKLYAWGVGLKVGDRDTLAYKYCDDPKDGSRVYGLWKRTVTMKGNRGLPKRLSMKAWWLGQLMSKLHPELRLPQMTKREETTRTSRFDLRVQAAIKVTLIDLLRPVSVRDVSFTIFGTIEQTPPALQRYTKRKPAGRFAGAGYTPEYWFNHKTQADALIVAFVQGARWWEYQKTGATLWASDRRRAENAAEERRADGTLGKSPGSALRRPL